MGSVKAYRAIIILMVFLLSNIVFATTDLSLWRGYGVVAANGEERYQAVYLPEIFYAYCNDDLSDLRIVDRNNKTVPYIIQNKFNLENRHQFNYYSLRLRSFNKNKDTYFDFQVIIDDEKTDVVVNQLEFELPKFNFLKDVELYGSYDGVNWKYILETQLYQLDNLRTDRIQLSDDHRYTHYRLVVLKNIEGINIPKLQLFNNYFSNEQKNFVRVTKPKYKVENKANESLITIENENRLKINEIKLDIDGNYRRQYSIYSDNYGLSCEGEIYNIRFKNVNLNRSTIDFNQNALNDSQIKLIIHNQDDHPVTIKNIEINYNIDKIIFDKTSRIQPFRVYFGNSNVTKPSYDLEKFREYIVREKMDVAVISDIQINNSVSVVKEKTKKYDVYFNLILIIITLILISFIIVKINKINFKRE